MSMSQLQQTMATLRLGLAEIRNKEEQLESMISQFRTQLRRLPRQVVYGQTPLDASLSALGEIEERLADAVAVHRRLLTIKKATLDELAALESVKQVDDAKASLATLKRRITVSGEDAETLAEMQRLQQFIAGHSKRAEAAITESYQARVEGGRDNTAEPR
jgi:chromosome segregation ATPase